MCQRSKQIPLSDRKTDMKQLARGPTSPKVGGKSQALNTSKAANRIGAFPEPMEETDTSLTRGLNWKDLSSPKSKEGPAPGQNHSSSSSRAQIGAHGAASSPSTSLAP